jgi:hypothetical protein
VGLGEDPGGVLGGVLGGGLGVVLGGGLGRGLDKGVGVRLPIVHITFIDHSAHLEGIADPIYFVAVGLLLNETKEGYTLGHWVGPNGAADDNSITSFVAKVKGMKVRKIATINFS